MAPAAPPPWNSGSVAIVGAGQIGTMLGMALVAAGASDVGLFDLDPAVARESLAMGGGHRLLRGVGEALAASTLILAVPVPAIVAFVEEHGPSMRPGTFVVDTGSAKAAVVAAMRAAVAPGVHAVGGHPLCGTERPGPRGARVEALRGATFVLTPVRDDPEAMARGRALAAAVGSRPLELDAETHDRLLARTSHLSHVVAFALALVAGEAGVPGPVGAVAGPGFAGATRLARSDPAMVAGFLTSNAEEVGVAIEELRSALAGLAADLDGGEDVLAKRLEGARSRLEALS